MSENVVIVGATSAIARAVCHKMAARGCTLVLAGRDVSGLESMRSDLAIRYGARVAVELFEATDYEQHATFFERCRRHFDEEITGVVVCHGYLPDQWVAQGDFAEARKAVEVNFLSVMSVLSQAANDLERAKRGYIVAISSVAGDRGRQSNYTYGASKAALTVFLQGLRNRLYRAGVEVITVKPGFVDTPMTQGRVNPTSLLVASPMRIATDIERAIRRRTNVVYTPWFWRWIMVFITSIPEAIFKRLRL